MFRSCLGKKQALSLLTFLHMFLKSLTEGKSQVEIQSAAKKHRLFPHVIKQVPSRVIEISYGALKVDLGNTLTSKVISNPPTQIKWHADEDMLYTLAVTGPDAKNLVNEECSYEHWLVGNIPGTDIKEGEPLSDYVGLLEGAYDTDAGSSHRLVFWLFEQGFGERISFGGSRINASDVGKSREVLALARFAEHYGLAQPIAINFCEVLFNNTITQVVTNHEQWLSI